jgi:putative transposase
MGAKRLLRSRVVERRFAFGPEDKEKFRTLMRMQEKFTGCRVLSYCLMCNHFHILLEVPPMPEAGIADAELLTRLAGIYNETFVAAVAKELEDAPKAEYAKPEGLEEAVAAIHKRFTYRMQDLGEFMKGLLQRFTQWFNRTQSRTGRLWEDRYKSVIVEDGVAAKTIAAYIDLNPVRAGMVQEIGSRVFVDEAFAAARERFGPNRKTGARKPQGNAAVAAGSIWSLRDLKKGI